MTSEVNIAHLKAHLSQYLRSAQKGNEIVVKDRETPIARLVPYQAPRKRLTYIPATGSLKDLDKLVMTRPKNLKPGDVDEALQWTRRDRFEDGDQ
jgi:prevent-host-death family protein